MFMDYQTSHQFVAFIVKACEKTRYAIAFHKALQAMAAPRQVTDLLKLTHAMISRAVSGCHVHDKSVVCMWS